jgi:VanZ family protein
MKRWIWPLFLGLTIFIASSSNSIPGPDIINFDKLVHFLIFGLVGVLVLRSRKPITWRWAFISILLVSCYGAMDELRQAFTPGRAVEWQDWLADTLGACVSIFLYKAVPLYSTLLEAKLPSKTGQTRTTTK